MNLVSVYESSVNKVVIDVKGGVGVVFVDSIGWDVDRGIGARVDSDDAIIFWIYGGHYQSYYDGFSDGLSYRILVA